MTTLRATCSGARRGLARGFLSLSLAGLLLAGCREQEEAQPLQPRPVRTVTAKRTETGDKMSLTGQILAENEASLGFRIGGRIIERFAGVGDLVTPDKVLARLDPQDELNGVRSASAALSAAEGRSIQASNNFDRQNTLMQRGFTTRVLFDQAEQELRTARSAVDDAQAQLQLAEDRLGHTELRANVAGSVTARLAEAGEVVQPGQTIFQVAREDGRDAVFDAPATVLRAAPANTPIAVVLTDDPSVKAEGRVRTVDPQADPVTRTFRVRVGLIEPPAAMRLGATVTGTVEMEGAHGVQLPASALTKANNHPAVWIVDPKSATVSLRNVDVARFDPATVLISEGLADGDIVVTAGVQALHPGQQVRILGSQS